MKIFFINLFEYKKLTDLFIRGNCLLLNFWLMKEQNKDTKPAKALLSKKGGGHSLLTKENQKSPCESVDFLFSFDFPRSGLE